jgi:hypothetical protein
MVECDLQKCRVFSGASCGLQHEDARGAVHKKVAISGEKKLLEIDVF